MDQRPEAETDPPQWNAIKMQIETEGDITKLTEEAKDLERQLDGKEEIRHLSEREDQFIKLLIHSEKRLFSSTAYYCLCPESRADRVLQLGELAWSSMKARKKMLVVSFNPSVFGGDKAEGYLKAQKGKGNSGNCEVHYWCLRELRESLIQGKKDDFQTLGNYSLVVLEIPSTPIYDAELILKGIVHILHNDKIKETKFLLSTMDWHTIDNWSAEDAGDNNLILPEVVRPEIRPFITAQPVLKESSDKRLRDIVEEILDEYGELSTNNYTLVIYLSDDSEFQQIQRCQSKYPNTRWILHWDNDMAVPKEKIALMQRTGRKCIITNSTVPINKHLVGPVKIISSKTTMTHDFLLNAGDIIRHSWQAPKRQHKKRAIVDPIRNAGSCIYIDCTLDEWNRLDGSPEEEYEGIECLDFHFHETRLGTSNLKDYNTDYKYSIIAITRLYYLGLVKKNRYGGFKLDRLGRDICQRGLLRFFDVRHSVAYERCLAKTGWKCISEDLLKILCILESPEPLFRYQTLALKTQEQQESWNKTKGPMHCQEEGDIAAQLRLLDDDPDIPSDIIINTAALTHAKARVNHLGTLINTDIRKLAPELVQGLLIEVYWHKLVEITTISIHPTQNTINEVQGWHYGLQMNVQVDPRSSLDWIGLNKRIRGGEQVHVLCMRWEGRPLPSNTFYSCQYISPAVFEEYNNRVWSGQIKEWIVMNHEGVSFESGFSR